MKILKRSTLFIVVTLTFLIGVLFTFSSCTGDNEGTTTDIETSMVFNLPELGYEYDSLEPYIDAETMEIHHTKHHNSYTNNLNAELEKHPELNKSIEQLLANPSLIPADIRVAVQNNGGGYYNHSLYFSVLKINNGQLPTGDLLTAINEDFGSYEEFKEAFANAATTQFGSGWAWLVLTKDGLKVVATQNQDTPLNQGTPILCIDVWEHAYYLQYQNLRSEYVLAFFNIINWDKVAELYQSAK